GVDADLRFVPLGRLNEGLVFASDGAVPLLVGGQGEGSVPLDFAPRDDLGFRGRLESHRAAGQRLAVLLEDHLAADGGRLRRARATPRGAHEGERGQHQVGSETARSTTDVPHEDTPQPGPGMAGASRRAGSSARAANALADGYTRRGAAPPLFRPDP